MKTRRKILLLTALTLSVPVSAHAKPWDVIDEANRSAKTNPDRGGYFNAIMKFDFEEGRLYQIYCAPLRITDIQLEPGEALTSDPVGGDTVRWIIARTKSKVNGLDQEHIYIKPTRPGLKTTLSINTNVRTYHLELVSDRVTYMAGVSWNYEQYNLRQIKTIEDSSIDRKVNMAALNFDYSVKEKNGSCSNWKPVRIFDDGQKTYIQFPDSMKNHESPVLFVLGHSGDMQLVNYRHKDNYYIVDRLFDKAELREGQNSENIVRITRKLKARSDYGF
jgi:type IV secretion system protein VirB9